MNKKTLVAGFIVLAIGISLGLVADQIISSNLTHNLSLAVRDFAVSSLIIGYVLDFAGVILLIYGAILPDPPVHWDNDL